MLLEQSGVRPSSARHLVRTSAGFPEPLPWATQAGLDVRYLERLSDPPVWPGTVSVIVPSWNSERTLGMCVASLIEAAAVAKAKFDAEIIVVDDGSTTPAADVLRDSRLASGPVEVRVAELDHGGQSLASNTGAQLARGDLLVFCDSDMIVHPWALLDLHRASAVWPDALCFGFRQDVSSDDPRLRGHREYTNELLIDQLRFSNDNRIRFDTPGVPSNLLAATRHLQDLRNFGRIRPPGRATWWLARMAYGCLVALNRRRFLDLGGFDCRFIKWGYNDTELATRWIASGGCLVPVLTANAFHVRHQPRHPAQWRNAGAARRLYEESLLEPAVRTEVTAARVRKLVLIRGADAPRSEAVARPPIAGRRTAEPAALVGDRRLFEEAVECSALDALGDSKLKTLALRVLRLSGASEYLEASASLSGKVLPDASLEGAMLALALDAPDRARECLDIASESSGFMRPTARYLRHQNPQRLVRIARWHLERGVPRAAASGLLVSRLRLVGAVQRDRVGELLLTIDACDRRIF